MPDSGKNVNVTDEGREAWNQAIQPFGGALKQRQAATQLMKWLADQPTSVRRALFGLGGEMRWMDAVIAMAELAIDRGEVTEDRLVNLIREVSAELQRRQRGQGQ